MLKKQFIDLVLYAHYGIYILIQLFLISSTIKKKNE